MNEHELLDRLALIYVQQKKKPQDAYDMAIDLITTIAIEKHKKLDLVIKRKRNRGEI